MEKGKRYINYAKHELTNIVKDGQSNIFMSTFLELLFLLLLLLLLLYLLWPGLQGLLLPTPVCSRFGQEARRKIVLTAKKEPTNAISRHPSLPLWHMTYGGPKKQ